MIITDMKKEKNTCARKPPIAGPITNPSPHAVLIYKINCLSNNTVN